MYFETRSLVLRKPVISDADDYMEFVNSEFVQCYNAMTPVEREKAETEFANAPDDFSVVAIELKKTGRVIGMIFVQEDSLRYGVASKEISYFLREEESGKGYMKEALEALISYLFDTKKLTCVSARCFLPNVASQRLLESLDFRREGVVRKCVKGYHDIIFDDCIYSLMREDLL